MEIKQDILEECQRFGEAAEVLIPRIKALTPPDVVGKAFVCFMDTSQSPTAFGVCCVACLDVPAMIHYRMIHWSESDALILIHWSESDALILIHWSESDALILIHWSESDALILIHWSESDALILIHWSDSIIRSHEEYW